MIYSVSVHSNVMLGIRQQTNKTVYAVMCPLLCNVIIMIMELLKAPTLRLKELNNTNVIDHK